MTKGHGLTATCFLVGVCVDLLSTYYTVSASSRHLMPTMVSAFLFPICQAHFFRTINTEELAVRNIVAYAFGNAIGAGIVLLMAK